MIPQAFVRLDELPLTRHGKLDRKALPDPDPSAVAREVYVAPIGATEEAMAAIWAEVLGIEQVGRHDNFFELGGHSLLAVSLTARLRQAGLQADVRTLFGQPTVAALAATLGHGRQVEVPANRIPAGCTRITPDMLPLVDLEPTAIERIVATVPGGAANVQDIYPLAPLQEGILYHHLSSPEHDPYVLQSRMAFDSPARLEAFARALRQAISRHDVLRTAVLWEGLAQPLQVVWREAPLLVAPLDGQDLQRLDLARAPLIRLLYSGVTGSERIEALLQFHHIVLDHTALEIIGAELLGYLQGSAAPVQAPVPYRNYVAQARLGVSQAEHEAFFRAQLGDIDEPTLPYGLSDVQGDGQAVEEAWLWLDETLAARLRQQARQLGISPASLFHLAFARLLAAVSGTDRVVFGTVLLGRLEAGEGAERALGMFINTLPLRLDLAGLDLQDALRLTQQRLSALLVHEHASLALAQRCSGVPAPAPLFSAMLNYRHGQAASEDRRQQWQGIEFLDGQERSNYPLSLSVDDMGEGFRLVAMTPASVGAQRICGQMRHVLQGMVEGLEAQPRHALLSVPVLPDDERGHLLQAWNATAQAGDVEQPIQALFEQQVARDPEAVAVQSEEGQLSYRQLNAEANRLAHHLIALGVQPDDRVAICVERGLSLVVGLLAILKAGGAYVPLDPDYPADRIGHMLADSQPRVLLVQRGTRTLVGEAALPQVDLDQPSWAGQPDSDPRVPGLNGAHLAYVIYTSGSTGLPKGVMVEHRNLANLVHWSARRFPAGGAVLHKTPVSFDASVWELFWPLCSGLRLVLAKPDGQRDPQYLAGLIRQQQVGVVQFVPALLQQFLDQDDSAACASLTDIVCGGGELTEALARQVRQRLPQVRLHNVYGPTETTVDCSVWTLEPGQPIPFGALPIGHPIDNTCLYVLDAHDQPVPWGVAGQLHIGGAGVARGYLGLPEQQAERFIASPFVEGERLYRSGDLVRQAADGSLTFLGRTDHQIKLRGLRIEPGEIEACLNRLAGVREALVLVQRHPHGGDRLVAYHRGEPQPADALRQALLARLPEYMVPALFIHLDSWPLTPNGKLDRKALPLPDLQARQYEAPQGETEVLLAEIWSQLLGVERVGRHDNFFELGGHSLLAVTLTARLRQAGLQVDVRTLFGQPSVAALAATLGQGGAVTVPANRIPAGCTQITPDMLPLVSLEPAAIERIAAAVPGGAANVQDIYPLAPLQEGILYLHLSAVGADPYALRARLRFDSPARLQAFAQALEQVIARHDILRTAVLWDGLPQPVQVVWRQAPLQLAPLDDAHLARLDLGQAPLIRLLHRTEPGSQRVEAVLQFHHIVLDHIAMQAVQAELRSYLLGQSEPLPASVPYRNYVAQARLGVSEAEHEAFFRDRLGDIDEPSLPFGLREVQGDGRALDEAEVAFEGARYARLRDQARQLGVSTASLVHLAWARLLAVACGKGRVVFGTVLLGRLQGGEGSERALGMFINTLPLRVELDGLGVRDGVLATHRELSALLVHEHASLALAQRCSQVAAPLPLFSAMLNYRQSTRAAPQPQAWEGIETLGSEGRTNYPLSLNVDDFGDGLRLGVQVSAQVGAQRVCAQMLQVLDGLLLALEQQPQQALNRLPVLNAEARRQVLVDFNDTTVAYDLEQTLHGMIEAQVRRMPQAIAVKSEEGELTYRQLDEQANRLAHHLIALGLKPDDRVAICVERGLSMVVGLLAILKAGGAYVPVDPDYPAERIRHMLDDSAPRAVLVHGATRDVPQASRATLIDLDRPTWQAQPAQAPQVPGLTPRHLAYVIYTSGSTGLPKGVMNEHAGVVNRLLWMQDAYRLGAGDVVLQKTPFSFDVSVWEFLWPLQTGARLVMARPGGHRDPEYLREVIREEQVSTLHFVPSMLDVFLAHGQVLPHQLKRVLCSGEALPGSLVRRFHAQLPTVELHNLYGPTEAAVDVSAWHCVTAPDNTPIGKPIANTALYVLDAQGEPVPVGVAGELYIGGVQVARGYLNREQLTAERFLDDPFSLRTGGRMYRTGDLARYLADGNLEYLGRNDDQVKIRGLRIELGEIQACLTRIEGVKEAVVLAREQRLVAYYTGARQAPDTLRAALLGQLPEFMVPASFTYLEALPLSPNGKLDRKALPQPEATQQVYEAPQGEVETLLAQLWSELLGVDRVGRHDNFFELGGHSLLAVTLTARMRQAGLAADVRVLFGQPSLAALAAAVGGEVTLEVPANRIPAGCTRISPDMLPLATVEQAALDSLVQRIPGGAANIQDLYALAPLQQGILYHHLASAEVDPYVLQLNFAFAGQTELEAFVAALNQVIARHDILRTSVHWQGLDEAVQVVWREARLDLEPALDSPRLDLGRAPLMHLSRQVEKGRLQSTLLLHHILLDHAAMELLVAEVGDALLGRMPEGDSVPYRNYVAQARLRDDSQAQEALFRELLGDIDEPTEVFGLRGARGDGSHVLDHRERLDEPLALRLRQQARLLGISVASLVHQAWGQVLAQLSGREEVVFGTVLLGRLQGGEGAERALGMFINTLPLRVSVGGMDVVDGVRLTHQRLARLLAHEQASLALAQRCSGVPASQALFTSLLNYRHSAATGAQRAQAWQGIELLAAHERSNYPLVVSVDDLGDGFILTVQAVPQVEGALVCQLLQTALARLADTLADTPAAPLNGINALPDAERERVARQFNATRRDYPRDLPVHALFEAQAKACPDALAVAHGTRRWSYQALDRQANRLGGYLLEQGVQAGDRVALLLPRSFDLLAAQLAVSKCAAVFVPLDGNAPAERQTFMVADSQARLLLTHSDQPQVEGARRVELDRLDLSGYTDAPLGLAVDAGSVAYIMYTSGSTGTPKGVQVPHRAIVRLVINNGFADFNSQDRVAFASNPAFDASTLEVWAPLLNGGAVVVIDQDTVLSRQGLREVLLEQGVTVLWLTAGLFHQFADDLLPAFRALRYLMVGGDVLDPAVIARVLRDGAPQHLLNGYGPTEATTFSTTHEITVVGEGSIPIGKPIGNSRCYVLDARQQLLPVGAVGELYIAGDGVALGYLGQPELTAERFLPDPFNGGTMYRSGDLVSWQADGTLRYLGRADQQVKLRGFRIELGEIEARLGECPGVRDAAVIVREDAPGDRRLVAYFTGQVPTIGELHERLQGVLPDYMLPSAYVRLDALPLTANGKLDRRALPQPGSEALVSRAFEAPQGEIETALAAIWAEVLKVEQVGRHDHFFELGGHSLLAVSLIERMRKAGLDADVRVLFAQPTLAALAAAVGSGREVAVPENRVPQGATQITPDMLSLIDLDQASIDRIVATVPGGPANVQEIYPLAPLQEGILFHHLSAEQGDPYLLQTRLAFDSLDRLQACAEALQQVIDRHDILRTSVVWEGLGEPVQVVWRQAQLAVNEVTGLGEEAVIERLHAHFDARLQRLDLTQAPLLRLTYALDPALQRVVAVLHFHHLALDHTAMEVIVHELQAILSGRQHLLSAPVPYRTYVAQVRLGAAEAGHEAFFRDMLGDVDEPTLPMGLADVQGDGRDIEESRLPLDPALSRRVREQARALGVSAASLMHLAWARVVGVLAGRRDVVFGTVLMGRLQGGEGADRALGVFINTLPLRIDTAKGTRAAVQATHQRLSALLGHEHASLALAQRCSGVPASAPLFSALLNYRHSPTDKAGVDASGFQGMHQLGGEERSNYPLTLSVDDHGEGFSLSVLAQLGIGAERVAGWMTAAVSQLIQALEQGGAAQVDRLPILDGAQRGQVLEGFNATAVDYPQGQTVHALVEAQSPEALAVVQGELGLSYGELNQRANRLAHHLIERGVVLGDRVALCLERGPQRMVAMLAVLKAGAAYVPVDPGYPSERITYLLSDSAPALVLVESATEALAGDVAKAVLDADACADQPASNPVVVGLDENQLAYVIYTSGSTGQPKGVMVEHRTLANLIHWHCQAFDLGAGSDTSSVAGFGFDAMAWEAWPALCTGAVLHLPPASIGGEHVDELLDWWLEQPLHVSFLPTPVAEQALRRERQHPTLRTLLVGGDRLRQFDRDPGFALVNNYGPTETTVVATSGQLQPGGALHIGKPTANTCVYVLDEQRQPVPVGVIGELYIGGAQVARGYFNRPELTAERFVDDPFNGGRMYRTGDLVRWNADGTLRYLGRADQQVKLRGFRIELGEIEARLSECPGVRDAAVIVREDAPGDRRLVAYFTGQVPTIGELHERLQGVLPDYMLPSAYVRLDALPLTANGKLDRRALPQPGSEALVSRAFEAPQGEIETALAAIWAEVLKVEQVGRHDHFFELGGHSLLAVNLIERMRKAGLDADVRVLFAQPTLAALAAAVGSGREVAVPENRVPQGATQITADMLSLIELDQASIDRIVASVPGGAANVQEIYPLAPLQSGILYHHLSAEQGDPYLLQSRLAFDSLERLRTWAEALQQVIDRHDILRTSVVWEGLGEPVQVVWRQAQLAVSEVTGLGEAAVIEQLQARFDARQQRLDLTRAPLLRLAYAEDPRQGEWVALLQFHHLTLDHAAMAVVGEEMQALLDGRGTTLHAAVPYRNYVAQVCLGDDQAGHEAFFRAQLGDIDEPTLPYGLADVQGDGGQVEHAALLLPATLAHGLREQARQRGVSAASLVHLAWARVVGVLAGRGDVVFGTVLMGRLQAGEGADRALGMFINTLPLRVDTALPVDQALRLTHKRLSALLGHEHAPLALAQRCSGVAASAPLFSALLNYRHSTEGVARDGEGIWQGVRLLGGEERSNYPLTLSVDDLGEGFSLSVLAAEGLPAAQIGGWMVNTLGQLVQALQQCPGQVVEALPMLDDEASRQVLEDFNATAEAYSQGQTVHALVEAQAPEALAVVQGELRLSYGELNQRANRLAHHLIERGVVLGDRVALCLERGPQRMVAMLAVLKAGAAYVPVDPGYPAQRIAYLLSDSAPALVLVESTTEALVGDVAKVLMDGDDWLDQAASNPVVAGLDAHQLAYVIYTSGSTGQPKGVMVEHRTLANLIHWHCQAFALGEGSHTSSVAGFGFDAMAWEAWPALCAGALLHLPPASIGGEHVDELLDWWLEQPLHVSFLPTPVAEQALRRERQHPTLRTLLVGGDRLRQFDRDPGFALVNNYGPTETTVVATSGQLQPGGALHIGKPTANTCVYVLDEQRQPVPVGVIGELYIGGAQVARGYFNRPELTAERFVDDPFNGGRMYRTGDLVRWNADGTLDYQGRNDDQVKIRGVRVELGEIEAALKAESGIADAVVLVRNERLLAWFTAAAVVDLDTLRQGLQTRLPGHLIPQAFVRLDELPLTRHGKLDRKALPDPDPSAVAREVYVAPIGATEEAMAAIWAEVLGIEQVGRHDNFFELGGHSLLAVSLTARLRHAGLQADVRTLFGQPTVAALAATLGHGRQVEVPANRIPAGCTRITPDMLPLVDLEPAAIERIVATVPGGAANVQDIYPLAPLQEGILYHHLSSPEHDPYVLQSRMAFTSRDRLYAFVDALGKVIARHDVLRTSVLWDGLPQALQVVWRQADLALLEVAEEAAVPHALALDQAPLVRLYHWPDAQGAGRQAVLQFHHIVLDHTALDVLGRELVGYLQGASVPAEQGAPYRNYVAQARLGVSQAEHEAFFREQLGDIDEPTLPFGLSDVQVDGLGIEEAQLWLDEPLATALRQQARQLGISVASLFHLAYARLLAAASDRDSVVFGTVLLGRLEGGAGADQALGMFINTLPLRLDLAGINLQDAVRQTQQRLSALLAHEHASLALAQRCSGVPAPAPLFSAMLNYRHGSQADEEQRQALQGIETLDSNERSNYPLSLSVDDIGERFRLVTLAPAAVGAARVCEQMRRVLEAMAEALAHQPRQALLQLPVLSGEERDQLVHDFNRTAQPHDLNRTLQELFEAQALRRPEAVALSAEQGELSYEQLNAQANRLAHHLIALGVRPDDRVAICVERGLSLVVGLLAILKAGGAYVPLDPDYPAERIRHMLVDSQPRAVLVQTATRALMGDLPLTQVDLDQADWTRQPSHNPQVPGLTAANLAYVIYTSGSTGLPKGVMVEHRNVVNLVRWSAGLFPGEGALLHKTPVSFDASVWELFWPLCSGVRLVLARPDGHRDPQYVAELIRQQQVGVVQFVPALLQQFLEHDASAACDSLTDIVCGGGELTEVLVRQVRERLPRARLHNVYGPTETTVDCSVCTLHPQDPLTPGALPIGRPIDNTRLYVLDGHDQPVPLGVAGQLHIGGAGVARGYLGLPEQQAERFIASPFADGERLYRSGDRVRQRADGSLEFLGRTDHQIKLRGLRIEPGEIEACLTRVPGVREAVVLVHDAQPAGPRLVAYVTGDVPPAEALREALLGQLPEYMVPALFMALDTMPLTPNGKLDRKALPQPDLPARAYEAPQGDTEQLLARIWGELLGVERIGRHDNFFELGGHSLLAVTLTSRLREAGLEADVRSLFEHPTLAGYAAITDRMEIVL
nr:non-ribosomal peptide synthetase [Pseudomonas mosselii]